MCYIYCHDNSRTYRLQFLIMTLSSTDLLAFDLYKIAIKEAKNKGLKLCESNYDEFIKEAYNEAEYFVKKAKCKHTIPDDYFNGH